MAWPKMLMAIFGNSRPEHTLSASFDAPRVLATLANNHSINGSAETAQAIFDSGCRADFLAGDRLIIEGHVDDDVYFLLAGQVEIRTKADYRAFRSAPTQVGEMAALDSGTSRSATVTAASEVVVTWKVPGEEYRRILQADVEAYSRVQREMRERQRQSLKRKPGESKWSQLAYWTVLSLVAGAIAATLTWIVLAFGAPTVSTVIRAASSGLSFLVLFIYFFRQNPALVFRQTLGIVMGLIAIPLLVGFSFTGEEQRGDVVRRWSLSAESLELNWTSGLTVILPLIFFAAIIAWLEFRRQKD